WRPLHFWRHSDDEGSENTKAACGWGGFGLLRERVDLGRRAIPAVPKSRGSVTNRVHHTQVSAGTRRKQAPARPHPSTTGSPRCPHPSLPRKRGRVAEGARWTPSPASGGGLGWGA